MRPPRAPAQTGPRGDEVIKSPKRECDPNNGSWTRSGFAQEKVAHFPAALTAIGGERQPLLCSTRAVTHSSNTRTRSFHAWLSFLSFSGNQTLGSSLGAAAGHCGPEERRGCFTKTTLIPTKRCHYRQKTQTKVRFSSI